MNLSVTGCYVNLGGNYHGVIILLSIYFEWLRSNASPMHFFSTMCDYCFWTNQITLYIFQLKPLFSWCFGLQLTKAVFSLLKHTLNTGEFQRRKYAGNQTVWRRWLQWQTLIKIRAILTQPEDDATKSPQDVGFRNHVFLVFSVGARSSVRFILRISSKVPSNFHHKVCSGILDFTKIK